MGFRIVYADITQLKVDAIVNPTDQYFSGGGGVDMLIHEICGPALREATDAFGTLHLGEAKATPGFYMPCRYIIHTSGPRWRNSHFLEVSLLGSCYRNSVQLAYNLGCRSIAFPLISSRGKHFPKQQALTTAINAILECVEEYPEMEIFLTIYGKWVETIPLSFFENLSDYLYDTYEPKELVEEEFHRRSHRRMMNYEEERIVCENVAALGPIEADGRSFIKDLLDNPTRKNLDKVPVDENFAQMLNRLISERQTKTNEILEALGCRTVQDQERHQQSVQADGVCIGHFLQVVH